MRTSDGESLFVVEHAVATAAERASLGDLGFMERQHLQEWVLKNPTIISADALVISAEFDRWDAGSSGQPRDRLDVLALGRDGRLIVAELKVGTAPHTVELQAIGYAAMVAAFSEEDVVDALVVHLAARQQHVAESEALDQIRDHVGSALDPDLLVRPRIVLIAEDFRPTTKTTCVWLVEMGLDVTLVEVHGYRTDDKNLVTTSQVFPPPEINVVRPSARSRTRRSRGPNPISNGSPRARATPFSFCSTCVPPRPPRLCHSRRWWRSQAAHTTRLVPTLPS